MRTRIKLKGRVKAYIRYSIYLSILLCIVDVGIFLINIRAGALLAGYAAIHLIITLTLYF